MSKGLKGAMGKKKIVFLTDHMALAGIEMSLLGILNNIDYHKYDVTVLLAEKTGELLEKIPRQVQIKEIEPGVACYFHSIIWNIKPGNFFKSPADSLWKLVCSCKRLIFGKYGKAYDVWQSYLKRIPTIKEPYDIAIDFSGSFTAYVVERMVAHKKIMWNHFTYTNVCGEYENTIKYVQKINHIVTVSQEGKDVLSQYFGMVNNNIHVIYNILDVDRIRMLSQEKVKDFPFEKYQDRIKICSVGRLQSQKNFSLALEAAKLLKDKKLTFIWYIIGEGAERKKLEKLILRYKLEEEVFLLGQKENPYAYISECDIYSQTSSFEGLCTTVQEAQILGKPVVVTNIPGLRELVADNETGLIANETADSFAECISKMNSVKRAYLQEQLKYQPVAFENSIRQFYEMIEESGR